MSQCGRLCKMDSGGSARGHDEAVTFWCEGGEVRKLGLGNSCERASFRVSYVDGYKGT